MPSGHLLIAVMLRAHSVPRLEFSFSVSLDAYVAVLVRNSPTFQSCGGAVSFRVSETCIRGGGAVRFRVSVTCIRGVCVCCEIPGVCDMCQSRGCSEIPGVCDMYQRRGWFGFCIVTLDQTRQQWCGCLISYVMVVCVIELCWMMSVSCLVFRIVGTVMVMGHLCFPYCGTGDGPSLFSVLWGL